MWQMIDKSNGIRQQQLSISVDLNISNSCFQGSKEHIFFHYLFFFRTAISCKHLIHHGRFSGIGIPYQRYSWNPGICTLFSLCLTIFRHIFQFSAKLCQTMFDFTSVQFQFLFTGTFIGKSTATTLTAECFMHSHQSWQNIL